MNTNEQVISRFYTAFQQVDYQTMNACYSNDIVFSDPVFGLLQMDQVKKMWEMLCKNAKDLTITFGNIQDLGDGYYTCDWTATYTFSKTGRNVINRIKAYMLIQNEKIVEHSDGFSIYKWSKQALGLPGLFFGWSSFLQKKIRSNAQDSLRKFMEKK